MKKNALFFSIAIMVSINFVFTDIAKSQNIVDLSIYPPNPISTDDIILVSETLFGSGPCWLDSSFTAINAFDIKCDTYFSTGMLTVMCTSYDTFQLGALSDGTYQLHYNLIHPSASPQLKDSTTIVFTVGSVGLRDNDNSGSLVLFPNPGDGKVFMTPAALNEAEVVLTILAVNGKELKKLRLDATKSGIQLDLSDLPPGTYIYNYYYPKSKHYASGKLIIVKD